MPNKLALLVPPAVVVSAVLLRLLGRARSSKAMTSYKYVILGGGNAAGYAARQFISSGLQSGELCIITDEKVVAYERPALSKGFLMPDGAARLPGFHTCVGGGGERQDPAWYEQHGITYMTDSKVTSADVSSKTLTLASGAVVKYEKLIVATGARPVYLTEFNTPGAQLAGIHYLRNVADGEAIIAGIQNCKQAGGKVVVVGGGYIGMECAAVLSANGLDVTMVFPENQMLGRLLSPELATFYEGVYESKGIKMVKGARVMGFAGEGKVSGVNINTGAAETQLPASLVVVGVGARPNGELFAGQLAMHNGAIKVNSQMASSRPDVYAVGDVAAFPLMMAGGELVRQEHVTHARSSAAHAVKAIYGSSDAYDYLPFFYSRVFTLSWQFYGFAEGSVVHFGERVAGGKFGAFWVKDGKVVGAFLESGSADDNAAIKAVVLKRPAAPAAQELATQGLVWAAAHK